MIDLQLLTARDVAKALKVSASHVYRLAKNRIIPAVEIPSAVQGDGKRAKPTIRFRRRDMADIIKRYSRRPII